jgi:hypothetical protein
MFGTGAGSTRIGRVDCPFVERVLRVELVGMSGSPIRAESGLSGREREQQVKDGLVIGIVTVFSGRIG